VWPATVFTAGAVRSSRTIPPFPFDSPLRGSLEASPCSWGCPERAAERRVEGRYIFCATFRQVALPGRYPAHCPLEFGLSSRLRTSLRRGEPMTRSIHVLSSGLASPKRKEREGGRSSGRLRLLHYQIRNPKSQIRRIWGLSIDFLLDPVLFQLLVEIAPRRVERFRRFRDVPVVLSQLLDQERTLGGFLEFTERPRPRCG